MKSLRRCAVLRWFRLTLALAVPLLGCRTGGEGDRERAPVLVTSPPRLDFETMQGDPAPAAQAIEVTNAGGGTLGWSASVGGAAWLNLSPGTGTAPSTLTVLVDAAALGPGLHEATISITPEGGGAAREVPVGLVVLRRPHLAAAPAALRFAMLEGGAPPAARTFEVTNAGDGALAWTASTSGGAWLSAGPASGGAPATVTVAVDGAGLPAGEYPGGVVLTDAGADNSPLTVPVTLAVLVDPSFDAVVLAEVRETEHHAAAADLNGDGRADLAVTNAAQGTVTVLLATAAGALAPGVEASAGAQAGAVTAADLDGDGAQDLAVADPGGSGVGVLLGRGDGTFEAALPFAVGAGPRGVAAADLDGDGALDLVTANAGDWIAPGTVTVLLGSGDGTFGAGVSYPAGYAPAGVAAGDLDGDGDLDLAVADYDFSNVTSQRLAILDGDGQGTFAPPRFLAAGYRLTSVHAAQLDGVGPPDLVVGSESGSLAVLLATGGGAFSPAQAYPAAGSGARTIAVADLDADGALDLVVTPNCTCESTSAVLLGHGDGTFGAPARGAPAGWALAAADVDGDGALDLAGTDWGRAAYVARGHGDGTFAGARALGAGTVEPQGIAAGDLDGDQDPDLVAVDLGGSGVWVWLAAGGTGFAGPVHFPVDSAYAVALADVDGDGDLDVITGHSGSVSVLPGDGLGAFGAASVLATGGLSRDVTAGDLDGDGDLDLVSVSAFTNSAYVLLGDGAGSFAEAVSCAVGMEPRSAVLGDLDGDGALDLVTGNRSTQDLSVLIGTGAGTFGAPAGLSGAVLRYADLADLDGDGVLDLVHADAGATWVRLGRGDGGFDVVAQVPVGGAAGVIRDLNGDGHLDLALAEVGRAGVAVLLGAGDGTLLPSPRRWAASLPPGYGYGYEDASIDAADFDEDGRIDLACAGAAGGGYVTVLHNRTP